MKPGYSNHAESVQSEYGGEIMTIALDEIRRMTVTERLKLLGDIWETLVEEQAPLPLSGAEAAEIDRRLEVYRRHGDRGVSWDELDRRLEGE